MNADGSAGVDADISAGAEVPFLDEIGWTAVGSGAFVLIVGVALLVMGIRRPSNPTGHGTGHAPRPRLLRAAHENETDARNRPGLFGPGAIPCV